MMARYPRTRLRKCAVMEEKDNLEGQPPIEDEDPTEPEAPPGDVPEGDAEDPAAEAAFMEEINRLMNDGPAPSAARPQTPGITRQLPTLT